MEEEVDGDAVVDSVVRWVAWWSNGRLVPKLSDAFVFNNLGGLSM